MPKICTTPRNVMGAYWVRLQQNLFCDNLNGYASPTTQTVTYNALQLGTALIPLQWLPLTPVFSLTDILYLSYVTF